MQEPTSDTSAARDYDWIVIGSGFGGSVSALRLAEVEDTYAHTRVGVFFGEPGEPSWN